MLRKKGLGILIVLGLTIGLLVPTSASTKTVKAAIAPIGVAYSSHVQNIGWQNQVSDGDESGTDGKGLRLEGLKINLTGDLPTGASIQYQTQVQNVGWQDWVSNGQEAGTEGKGLREEGIRIKLVNLPGYSVQYRVHVQNIGWQNWVSDGALAGTVGQGLRLEALEVKIIKNSFSIGETATIKDAYSGTYELTINSVEKTSDRNPYANSNPAEVYKITYTYKLLSQGSDTSFGLYVGDFDSVIDNTGSTGDNYYPDIPTKYPQELKIVGTTCTAETFVGVNNPTDNLTLTKDYLTDIGSGYIVFNISTK